ncbi:MAG: hypothetical protein SOT28_10990 [Fusicatenibacter sp.]|nr:hypothetical protein [Fusicatenibacter sp.]
MVFEKIRDGKTGRKFSQQLLRTWSEGLLSLQISAEDQPELDGAIWCPACGRIHGRCFEAMYPFLCCAELEEKEQEKQKWIHAAEKLFMWAERNLSQETGAFLNDTDGEWKGTTVFNAIQMADCLKFHRGLLSGTTVEKWSLRLRKAADFLYDCDFLKENNINYPISNALALYECAEVLQDEKYSRKAEEWAQIIERHMTEKKLIFGEGTPRHQLSERGCRPIDIGYNVEETLPSFALYAFLTKNTNYQELARDSLRAHLAFLLPDGAWDNSFGTRNYKWSYWGGRTSDGCAFGYLLYGKEEPEFLAAAVKNLELLASCTKGKTLMGGPDYESAGQQNCIHHTFTHSKVLAGMIDYRLWENIPEIRTECEEKTEETSYFPELATWIVKKGKMRETVTAYDWEYLPGGHVSGGTLSMLHHRDAGTIMTASVGKYTRIEAANMQEPKGVIQENLALRIEKELDGICYSSIYDTQAKVIASDEIVVSGNCKDMEHRTLPGGNSSYEMKYHLEEEGIRIEADFTEGKLICPIISRPEEKIQQEEGKLVIHKKDCDLEIISNANMNLPYGEKRIFHLSPGLCALRIDVLPQAEKIRMQIVVRPC